MSDIPLIVAGGIVRNRDWILGDSIDAIMDQRESFLDQFQLVLHYVTGGNLDSTENVLRAKTTLPDCLISFSIHDPDPESGWERSGEKRYNTTDMARRRNIWIEECLSIYPKLTHLWSVDSDTLPAYDCLHSLLKCNHPVVGAHVPLQDMHTPAYMEGFSKTDVRNPRRTGQEKKYKDEPFRATCAGGCVLIRRDAIDAGVRWGPHPQGEDAFLGQECRRLGIDLFGCPSARTTHVMDREKWERGEYGNVRR